MAKQNITRGILVRGSFAEEPRNLWRGPVGRIWQNKLAVAGIGIVALFLLVGIFAPLLAPYDYEYQTRARPDRGNGGLNLPPFWIQTDDPRTSGKLAYIMGTDNLGRDTLSRVIYATRISAAAGFIPLFITVPLGMLVGMTAGYFGGKVDGWLMRLVDVFYAFPNLLFVLLAVVTLRNTFIGQPLEGEILIFLAIGVSGWVDIARVLRAQILALREHDFILAARSVGVSPWRIMLRHLLPNASGPLIATATMAVPTYVITEVILEYMGVGVRLPYPSWGNMIAQAISTRFEALPYVWLPAVCIALVTLAFTFLGDGVRDAFDTRMG